MRIFRDQERSREDREKPEKKIIGQEEEKTETREQPDSVSVYRTQKIYT